MIIPPLDMPVRGVPTRHAAHTLPCQNRSMPSKARSCVLYAQSSPPFQVAACRAAHDSAAVAGQVEALEAAAAAIAAARARAEAICQSEVRQRALQ